MTQDKPQGTIKQPTKNKLPHQKRLGWWVWRLASLGKPRRGNIESTSCRPGPGPNRKGSRAINVLHGHFAMLQCLK
ncbi:hypothetical protein E4U54_003458 [Claviceps lovelessii]|nr:hypothetical protein E4U54_003458 [Claviceps lovelessii]